MSVNAAKQHDLHSISVASLVSKRFFNNRVKLLEQRGMAMSEIGLADMVHCVSLFMDAQSFVSRFLPKVLGNQSHRRSFSRNLKKLLQPVVVCLSTVVQRSAQITQISLLMWIWKSIFKLVFMRHFCMWLHNTNFWSSPLICCTLSSVTPCWWFSESPSSKQGLFPQNSTELNLDLVTGGSHFLERFFKLWGKVSAVESYLRA